LNARIISKLPRWKICW